MKPESWWRISIALLLIVLALLTLLLIYDGAKFLDGGFSVDGLIYAIIWVIPFWTLSLAAFVQYYRKKKSGYYLALLFAVIFLLIVILSPFLLTPVLKLSGGGL